MRGSCAETPQPQRVKGTFMPMKPFSGMNRLMASPRTCLSSDVAAKTPYAMNISERDLCEFSMAPADWRNG